MQQSLDAIIVGAGMAGIYAVYHLRRLGLSVRLFEAGSSVGGTWYWNRYPGARVDIESMEYSYAFSEELQQEWEWSERYAGQAELARYFEFVTDRFEAIDRLMAGEGFAATCAALAEVFPDHDIAPETGALLRRWVDEGLLTALDTSR